MPTQRERRRGRELPPALANPHFPAQLPITPRMGEIVDLLRRHQVLVVAGETGSGKTTQLPKACLAAGIGRSGAIAHTQPRRVAARTVSARIAEELGVELGREVGYAVRFADRTSAETVVEVMTDGLLLNEIQRDRRLNRYQCVIVDEAHERSLNVDFILGYLKRLLARRRDLKVIVTSATIDVGAFASHFDDAPVVQVSGRGYPVETVYRPVENDDADQALVACLETILRDAPSGRRDILVFQTGEREISDNARLLKRAFDGRLDVLPLYARLPNAEQQRVFAPSGKQRVVLATNVAETSITVPNIGYVVDPGFARISRYSFRAKLQRLPVEPVSQASAAQRAGRCGRIAPGVCYRLYDADDLAARPPYTDAEIKRTNLASVVLTMRAFGLGRIDSFPFIDAPHPRAISDAHRLLHELQAIDDDDLTPTGRQMARLPVDPRLARMLIEAGRCGALAETLVIVAALASQDPRLRPLDRREAADQAHARFEQNNDSTASADDTAKRRAKPNERSDFVVYLNLWRWLEGRRAELGRSAFRRLLEKSFLSPARVREWQALHRQLRLACRELGMKTNAQPADYATLHRALLSGSLGFIGHRREPEPDRAERQGRGPKRSRLADYDGARGLRFNVFPASALNRRPPAWVVAAEISDTGRTWARCVAALEPAWIEAAGSHIKKSTFSAPRWDDARGEAVVDERVTIYGLTVVAQRPRRAAETEPETARQLFVQEVLVKRHRGATTVGANATQSRKASEISAPFLDRNERLLRRLDERQARGRRMDLLVSERACADFYLVRLPSDVCSVARWRRFLRDASAAQLAKLEMSEADLLAGVATRFADEDFPTRLVCGERHIPLGYKFAPGETDDGVTARVDLAQLAQLDADALDWLVPGFFEEKCIALFRALPKAHRRQLAPVPDRVRAILPRLLAADGYRRGKLSAALSTALHSAFGIAIPASAWRLHDVPPHLRMNVKVAVGTGKRDQDRDVEALRERALATAGQAATGRWRDKLERLGIVKFPNEGVPDSRVVCGREGRLAVYPVIVDRGDDVDLLMSLTGEGRAALNRTGYARLALLADPVAVRHLRRPIERDGELALHYAPLGTIADLADAVLLAAAWFAYFEGRPLPTTAEAFAERLTSTKLAPVAARTVTNAKAILARRFKVATALDGLDSPTFAPSVADMAAQLEDLAGARFLATASSDRLADVCRYLDGMAHRIANLRPIKRDLARMEVIKPWQDRLAALRDADGERGDGLIEELRYLVEEYRIATFSQRLGTREKVSGKRLEVRFAAVENRAARR